MWVRADGVTGYVCEFEVYTGKTDGERELELGVDVDMSTFLLLLENENLTPIVPFLIAGHI